MALNEDKYKKMQDEMSRFEEEIGLPIPEVAVGPAGPRIIGAHTYNEAQKTLAASAPGMPSGDIGLTLGGIPPPPPPPPIPFIPPQVRGLAPMDGPRGPMDGPMSFNGGMPFPRTLPPPPMPPGPMPPHLSGIPGGLPPPPPPPPMPQGPMPPGFGMMPPHMMPVPQNFSSPPAPPSFQPMDTHRMQPPRFQPSAPQPPEVKVPPQPAATVLSATPMMYMASPQVEISPIQSDIGQFKPVEASVAEDKTFKIQNKRKTMHPVSETIFTPAPIVNPPKKKEKKNKKLIRTAGGQSWEDSTLGEWEDDDFRLFCGDLGNDVTDEVLTRAFSKYPSFLKARVVRDKRTNKTKGFGFVSFKDPQDFIRATKEMNGRYVGSRPIKLRKSSWKNRSLDVVRKKEKEKVALINMLTGR